MDPMVIEVNGIPDIPPHNQMADQLKFHFMRRSNNGGDVLMVIYPTSTSGQAYVIFESDEVPGVLESKHFLETDGKFYPIRVKNSHLSKVDMQVETTLDLRMFQRPEEVEELVTLHGFKVTKYKSGLRQLHGSFIKLKLLRGKLMLLQRDSAQTYNGSSSALLNGSSLTSQMKPSGLDPTFGSKPKSKHDYMMGNADLVGSVASAYKDLNLDGQPSYHSSRSSATKTRTSPVVDPKIPSYAVIQQYQPTSLPLTSNFSTTYQRDFSGLDSQFAFRSKSGYGYDTGNERGAYNASAYRDSPTAGSSASIHSRYSPTQDQSSSTSASYFDSFPQSQLESRSSNTTSRQTGLDQSSGSQKNSETSTRRKESHQMNTDVVKYKNDIRDKDVVSRNRRPFVDGASSLSEDLPSTRPSSAGSLRSLLGSDEDTFLSSSKRSFSPSTCRVTSFLVDTDTLNYVLTQKQDIIKMIERTYCTEMSLHDSAEFTTVTFKGSNCEEANHELQAYMTNLSSTLRTQEIDLTQYDRAQQEQILKRIEHLKEPGVLIKRNNEIVKIVGSSRQSFEVKQKLLAQDNEPQRGRTAERSSRSRRSSSVPNKHKIPDQQRHSPNPEAQASSVTNSYPEKHPAQDWDAGNAALDARDLQKSTKNERSSSESREKNRTTKELQKHQREDLPASHGDKKSKLGPKYLKNLFTDMSASDIKRKLQRPF